MHTLSNKEKRIALYIIIGIFMCSFVWYVYRCSSIQICRPYILETVFRPSVKITLPSGHVIKAEVAQTNAAREQGLSGRGGLLSNHGMLFEFPLPGRYGFWMKDMLFPIDMIWMTEDGVVVNVVEDAKPEDYPATYVNQAPASYVLEVAAHTASKEGIYLGSTLRLAK